MRLTTWNVLHGRSPGDGRVDSGRLRAAAASLDADVIALQEADRGQPRSGRRDLTSEVAAALGAGSWSFRPALIGSPGIRWRAAGDADNTGEPAAYGVGLASRYPVRTWHTLRMAPGPWRLPVPGPGRRQMWWCGDEPRVALAAVVQTPHGDITIASTHLSFLPGQNIVQLRRLSRWLRSLPAPRILLGDLNMPPGLAAPASGFEVVARAATYPAPTPRVQLDHVLGHGTLPPARGCDARALPVSDHCALSVQLSTRC